MKNILLTAFLLLSSSLFAQQQLTYKIGAKTTGKEIISKETMLQTSDPMVMTMQSTGNDEIAETMGALSVSSSGAAVYNIPIALPPGIGGVQPELSITYSSQGGSGLAGWGWNVSSVSSITRISATTFHDGRVGKVDFTSGSTGDRFSLNGQRLMLKSGTYGADGSVYETEQFSNLKITAYGVSSFGASYGPAYFRVDYPDGSYAVFGNGSNSLSRTTWAVTYRENASGLRISYSYTIVDNNLVVTKISYGSAGAATPINEVQFIYGTRSRTEQSYIGGISFMNKSLLKEVRVFGSGNVGYRSYIITHNVSSLGYDRLTSVQEKSGDGTLLHAPVSFSYNNTTNAIGNTPSEYTYMENVEQRNAKMVALDYNGDGKMESIVYPTTGTYGFKKFWFLKDFQQQGSYSYPIEYTPPSAFKAIFPTDLLYADGKKQPGQGITLVQETGTSTVEFNVYGEAAPSSGVPIGSQYQRTWTAPTYTYQSDCSHSDTYRVPLKYVSGDFNGDGLTDILAITLPYSNSSCTAVPGCSAAYQTADSATADNNSQAVQLKDSVTSNSSSDATPNAPPPVDCCQCTTSNVNVANFYIINLDRRLTTGFTSYAGYFSSGYSTGDVLYTEDVDGDGRTDIILVKEGTIYVFGMNQNNMFTQLWTTSDSRIKRQYPTLTGDYNGDGKSDIMIPTADNSSLFALFLSTGTGFVKTENTYPFTYRPRQEGATSRTYDLVAVDVDGDSKTDIVDYSTVTYNSSDNGTQTLTPYYNTPPSNADGRPAFTAGTSVTRTGNLRHFPIPVFLPSDKPNVNLEFAAVSHKWVTYFQFKRDQREEALMRSVNQNGVVQSIDYRPLENGATHPTEGFTVYARGLDQVYPYTDIVTARSFQVVQGITRTVNGTVSDKQYFAYKGAVLHLQGLRFLGFEGVAQTNRHTAYNNRIFSVVLSNPQLRGAPIQQHSLLYAPSFSAGVSGYISKTVHTYQSELLSNKVFKLKNTQSVDQNALEGTTVTRQAQYDTYNNATQVTTTYSGAGTLTVNLTYANSTGTPYYIGRPSNVTVTRTLSSQAAFVTTEQWDYTTSGLISQHRWKGNNITNFNKEDFTYDSYGNLLSKTTTPYGSAGRTVSFTYDATKRFITGSTDIEGLSSTAVYNAVTGKLLSQTNPFSQTVSFAYDAWGRLITTTDIYGKQTTVTYTKNSTNYNYTIAGSAQNGAGTEQEFDPFKRLIRESYKNALGQWVNVKTEYDVMGRLWRKSEPYTGTTPSQWTTTEYDIYSRPVKVTLPTGKVTNMSYSGLSVTINDGAKTTVTTKNAIGLVTTQQDPGGSINYTYYSNGTMKTADYGGSVQTTEQDGWGQRTKLIDPSAGEYSYQYNAWSELTKEVSPKGSTEYQYDTKGKLTQKKVLGDATTGTVPTNMVTVYTYDATTKLPLSIALTNADGNNSTTTLTYDSYKRVSQTVEENPKARFTKAVTYDAFGRTSTEMQVAVNKSNSKTTAQNLTYTYQNNVLKKIVSAEAGAVWELSGLNARGQLTGATLGSSGLQQQKTYDSYGLLSGTKILNQAGTELFNQGYTWNAQRGLLTGRSTTLFTSGGQALSESFQYDGLDRLTQWSNPVTGTALTQSYDTRGRIESNGAIGTYTYASTTTYRQKDVTLNTAGQTYYSGHEVQQAVYNNFKQPIEITEPGKDKLSFQYGAGGQRAHMQWGRTYSGGTWGSARYQRHYSMDGSMEITEDAQTTTTTFALYIGGDAYNAPAVWRSVQGGGTTNEMLYLHRDHLGSIVAITTGAGVIKEKRHFDAWGNLAKLQDGSGNTLSSFTILDRGYTSHEHLTVGLVHMNGRLYDPGLHRFLMPDNFVQDAYNTQSFNRYAYVLNNPLSYTDPSGELTEAQWNEALDMMSNILNSTGGGGYIGGDMTTWVPLSQEQGLGYGIGYMNTFNGWGSQPGWAGSAQEAINNFNNGGNITPGMVEGYYTQQWAGMGRENISASYSAKGGFNVGYNFDPGVGNGTGVGNLYVSDEKMAGLMGNDNKEGGYDWGYAGNVLTAGGIVYAALENAVANKYWWMNAKGNYNSTKILEKGVNGKYVRGVQGLRNGYNSALKAASGYKVAGNVFGGLSLLVTGAQLYNNQITVTEATIDAAFGIIGFLGPIGAGISAIYFIGKFGYEYFSGNTLFEKPR